MSGLIKYLEQRAAEDALYGHDLAPTQLCRLLLPVWRAQVEAEIYQSQPYDLIDRYVAEAIDKAGLCTVAEIAAFYGLDTAVVGGAARFLMSVGHLTRSAGERLTLTELGLRSVRDGKRYVRSVKDRRQVYFDGFTRRPLRSAYYNEETVAFLDGVKLARLRTNAGEPGKADVTSRSAEREAFTPVMQIPLLALGQEAVNTLARLSPAERARVNLPEEVVGPTLADAEQVYLPAYVVRAVAADGAVQYLAYTQVSDEADDEWSRVCGASAEVSALVENEYRSGDREGQQRGAQRWIAKVFADVPGTGRADIEWRDRVLTARLPAVAFDGDRGPKSIGSLIPMDGGCWYFRLWCDDESLRRQGLLDLADLFLGSRQRVDPDPAARRLARFGRQLGFGPLAPAAIGVLARQAGRSLLAAQIDRLT